VAPSALPRDLESCICRFVVDHRRRFVALLQRGTAANAGFGLVRAPEVVVVLGDVPVKFHERHGDYKKARQTMRETIRKRLRRFCARRSARLTAAGRRRSIGL
jgi:hypothetical protein